MKTSLGPLRIGANIRKTRKRKGISQEALATAARVARAHLGVIERGKGNPNVKTLIRIANKLGVQTKDLFDF